jgi:hypothetical protein
MADDRLRRQAVELIRAITDVAEGVYDGLTLGAEATFAAEGIDGQLRYDPMSMRPFMAYPEGAYAAHWLKIIGQATEKPIFAHVNWFQRNPDDGHFLWPGYRDNLRPPPAASQRPALHPGLASIHPGLTLTRRFGGSLTFTRPAFPSPTPSDPSLSGCVETPRSPGKPVRARQETVS